MTIKIIVFFCQKGNLLRISIKKAISITHGRKYSMFHIHKKHFFINQPIIIPMSIFQQVKMPSYFVFFSKPSQEETRLPDTVNEQNGTTFYICALIYFSTSI